MENAILAGTVRKEPFIQDKPKTNMYIVEIVTRKRIKKRWVIFKEEIIDTKEIILKNCLYCGAHIG
jgi:hypothetical protein